MRVNNDERDLLYFFTKAYALECCFEIPVGMVVLVNLSFIVVGAHDQFCSR